MYIPSHIKRIDNDGFMNCRHLKQIIFEKNSHLTSIGDYAFFNTSIESISIQASTVNLGKKWCAYIPILINITVDINNPVYLISS